jgi:hypothetical protein
MGKEQSPGMSELNMVSQPVKEPAVIVALRSWICLLMAGWLMKSSCEAW